MLTNEFCVRGKFWEKDPYTHSPPALSVVGVSKNMYLKKAIAIYTLIDGDYVQLLMEFCSKELNWYNDIITNRNKSCLLLSSELKRS
jgi:hypothetical protein